MTSEAFLKEALESDQCPANFEQLYEGFLKYQTAVRSTLREFHRVCEKNQIPYQLTYGSLLGAVRDGGQIPWDYDVDVFVPYAFKNQLIEALKKDLGGDFYFRCPEVDARCRHYFMRVAPKGFLTDALHVDVFYLVGAPDETPLAFGVKLLRLVRLRLIKKINIRMETRGNLKDKMALILRRIKYLPIAQTSIDAQFHQLCSQYDYRQAKYLLSTDEWLDRQVLDADILNTVLLETEDGAYRVAACYSELLKKMYGDYHDYPPISQRIQEVVNAYNRLSYFHNRKRKH